MNKLIPYFIACFFLCLSSLSGQKTKLELNLVDKQLQFGLTRKVLANEPVIGIALSGGGAVSFFFSALVSFRGGGGSGGGAGFTIGFGGSGSLRMISATFFASGFGM